MRKAFSLKEMPREGGGGQCGAEEKTILLSTHILQEVEAMASRVIVINDGSLVYDGPVDELVQEGGLDESFRRLTSNGKAS